jgi:outer membrane lipoprotein-sorting protein
VEEIILIGDITEEKLEVESLGRKILEKALAEKYELLYIGDTKAPFDYIARNRETEETMFIELKTLRKQKFIIYTENEKEFAGRVSDGYKYWLYVVDLANGEIRGYLNPFIKGKLRPLTKDQAIIVNGKKYYVYEELSEADVSFSF